ncbi:hypothetical protein ACM66Z_05095 [Sulfurovum sp. ST-21]|uniref:Uncharacterized protein n=1 Tax=Sulfurovum indicum TaxID=2779528 RepID=A0A7M1S5Y9_9BACT|nr:hypothetical protein [Sulfurovum indicum]QOR62837.1 hypothetical protein IMZ28_05060 [Sulfurovum indicum]
MSKEKAVCNTQYTYEKRWVPTTKSEVLRIIMKEMPETDAEGTFVYIFSEIKKGKTVTLGECRFKAL